TCAAGSRTLDFNGVSVTMENDIPVSAANTTIEGVDSQSGTVYIRPTAVYQGDVNDTFKEVFMGTGGSVDAATKAYGNFSKNTLIRFDQPTDLATAGDFKWSYSTDGVHWREASGTSDGSGLVRLPLDEGYIDVVATAVIPQDAQIMIIPEDASLDFEIMKGSYISVNGVGKDIFGGYYNGKPIYHSGMPELNNSNQLVNPNGTAFQDDGKNLFEVVGNFIAYLETNNQNGCQESLAKLTSAEEYILTQSTKVGGLENRVDVAYNVLTSQKANLTERLSYAEDIDLTDLLVRMQQEQIAYQTVLQSASKIMSLSLANYL
ncbi:MAG: flagellar hook protein, partial [Desulfovibrio sp.]|nr:flagellar hook protein [Desulfovibrio sp.]